MSLTFEWDDEKAASNLEKHGIRFEEASTVFKDSLSLTISDPLHSIGEQRFITVGESAEREILVVVHTQQDTKFVLSAHAKPHERSVEIMKEDKTSEEEMLPEYDFSSGERGKYARHYASGTNVVLLSPDVAEAFPNAEAVNNALRALVNIARQNVAPTK